MRFGGGRFQTWAEYLKGEWYAWYPVKARKAQGGLEYQWVWREKVKYEWKSSLGGGGYWDYWIPK